MIHSISRFFASNKTVIDGKRLLLMITDHRGLQVEDDFHPIADGVLHAAVD